MQCHGDLKLQVKTWFLGFRISFQTRSIMSPLTVVSFSEVQASMETGHGSEVVMTIAVTYETEVIVVVDTVLTNNKQ